MAPRIDTLRAQVKREGFDTRRSQLWAYMRDHRAQIAEMRAEGATWPAIGEAMRKLGLPDRTGRPPTNETVRQTWAKIEKAKKPELARAPRATSVSRERGGARGGLFQAETIPAGGKPAQIEPEPDQPKRKFRRGATFRGTEGEE